MRTFIRRPGNKSKHINKFKHLLPNEYNVYIEPFVGSGALMLSLKPKKWIINDLHKDLMGVWKLVKNNPEKIAKSFKKFHKTIEGKSNKELLNICIDIADGFNGISKPDTCMFLLITMMSYTGSLIVNNKYCFKGLDANIFINNNFPYLKQAYYTNLLEVSDFLNSTEGKIYNTDYKIVLKKAKEGDFVFLDPPYVEDGYKFNYNKNEKLDTGVF
jgi:DNA adenine methylase